MNAVTQHTPSGMGSLVPTNMREAMDLATMMAKAGFLAKELQTPGGALFVIEQSMRWNMSPFAVAMETSFIQGKPMFSGKIVAAAVVSSGAIIGRLAYDYTGSGDGRTITVTGTLRGETEPRAVSVAVKDAKTSNRMWVSQPDQQLAYHGARVWARRHAPEVMLGVLSPEEMEPAPPSEPRHVENLAPETREAPPAGSMREAVSAQTKPLLTAELTVAEIPVTEWRKECEAIILAMHDAESLNEWWSGMEPMIAGPNTRAKVAAMVADKRGSFAEEHA